MIPALLTDYNTLSPLGISKKEMHASLMSGQSFLTPIDSESYQGLPLRFLGLIPGQLLVPLTQYNSEALIEQKKNWVKTLFAEINDPENKFDLIFFVNNTTPNNISYYSIKGKKTSSFTDSESSILQPEDFLKELKAKNALAKNCSTIEFHNTCASVTSAVHYIAQRIKLQLNKKVMIIAFENTNNNPLNISAIFNLKVMNTEASSINDAIMPFSSNRKGFIKADALGYLVLENKSSDPIAEILGGCLSSDSHSLTDGIEDGSMVEQTILKALDNSGVTPEQIDYINAHGSGTYLNDLIESRGIKRAFADVYKNISVATTKSQFGHALAATAVVEIASVLNMMENNFLAASINSQPQDAEIDLNLIQTPHSKKINYALKNSFGFGGYNSTIILRNLR